MVSVQIKEIKMCKLINENKNIFMELTPLSRNDFGIMCDLKLKTEVLCLDFEKVSETNRYMSYENINHIKTKHIKLKIPCPVVKKL